MNLVSQLCQQCAYCTINVQNSTRTKLYIYLISDQYKGRDDSSIGESLGQPLIMLNDHNQPLYSATYLYLLAGVILEMMTIKIII